MQECYDESLQLGKKSLSKAGQILRFAMYLFSGFFAVFAVLFTALLAIEVARSAADSDIELFSVLSSALSVSVFYLLAVVFYLAALVFKDIANGESPFTTKQYRRIRLISWLLFLYAVLDSVLPKGVMIGVGEGGSLPAIVRVDSSSAYYGVNVGLFAFAMVFFALSSVFRYGVELQELSDDVV